jgi:hypothetical protein
VAADRGKYQVTLRQISAKGTLPSVNSLKILPKFCPDKDNLGQDREQQATDTCKSILLVIDPAY